MTRVQLRVYRHPGEVEVFVGIKRKDGKDELLTALIDTGGQLSLFPQDLLEICEHQLAEHSKIRIEQAGIAKQVFDAIEAIIMIHLEDPHGNITQKFEIRAWFADTEKPLLGFDGVLDRAILHIDMLRKLEGWIEMDF